MLVINVILSPKVSDSLSFEDREFLENDWRKIVEETTETPPEGVKVLWLTNASADDLHPIALYFDFFDTLVHNFDTLSFLLLSEFTRFILKGKTDKVGIYLRQVHHVTDRVATINSE